MTGAFPDIDGKYSILSQSTLTGAQLRESDGFTIIKDGRTMRIDGAGCEWRSHFAWADAQHVKMVSVVDPTYAVDGFRLLDGEGRPTAEAQSYETLLTVTLREDGGIAQMAGTITLGGETISIIMRKAA